MERQHWADYSKGIAILLIVICHTVNGVITSGLTEPSVWWRYFSDLSYTFMVPVFFFLAGYFAEGSKARRGLRKFTIGLFSVIVYPYFLWSIVQILLMMVSGASNARPTWGTILSLPIAAYAQFWFLYALFLCYIFDVLLSVLKFKRSDKFLLSIVILILGQQIGGIGEQLYWLTSHYCYFVLGSLFSVNFFYQLTSRSLLTVSLATFTLLNYLFINNAGIHTPLRVIGAVVGILFVIVLSLLLEKQEKFSWLKTLGLFSLEIYCLHTIATAAIRYFILRIVSSQNILLHSIAGILIGIVLPLVVAKIGAKYQLNLFRWSSNKPLVLSRKL